MLYPTRTCIDKLLPHGKQYIKAEILRMMTQAPAAFTLIYPDDNCMISKMLQSRYNNKAEGIASLK